MPKLYRKKPVVIEAVQIREDNYSEVREFIESRGGNTMPLLDAVPVEADFVMFRLPTAHGDPTAFRLGDWIVPEERPGEFYPIKPDVFERTYEEAEDR